MTKQRKPLSTKKPPKPSTDHQPIDDWMTSKVMPAMQPLVKEVDKVIRKNLKQPKYAIKWGSVFYGSDDLGWVIELAAYAVTINIVFLNGVNLEPNPPLGQGDQTRYTKLDSIEAVKSKDVSNWIKQACKTQGWKF